MELKTGHSLVVSSLWQMRSRWNSMCSFVGGVLVCGLSVNLQFCKEWQLITQAVFPTPSLPLSTVHSVGQVPFALSCVGAHGWGAKICQLWEKSPSRNWLPIVEAPGCLRHPNSTLRCSCWWYNDHYHQY